MGGRRNMGFFENMKLDKMGKNAYSTHVQANDLHRRGRAGEAKAKFAEALKLYNEAYDAGLRKQGILMSHSVLLMRFGEFERAREMMKEVSAMGRLSEENHFELRVNYAICLWRMGIYDKALETIRYAGKHAKNSSYYSCIGSILVEIAGKSGEEADFEEARVLLDQAMDYDDEDAATLDSYGEYYRQKGIWAAKAGNAEEAADFRRKAIESFEKAHKAKPSQVTTLYALARFAIEDGDKEKAKALIDRAILHSGSRICPVGIEDLQALKARL